mgnify:CR=1 FL=1
MKRVFLYIRVSTQEQAQEGYSVGEQKERLVAYCKAHDWLITEIYADPGYSGSNLNRPGIQKLITDIKECDIVLVYKLDRFSRNKYETAMHKKTLRDNGVKLVSAMENIPDTPEGIILESLLEGMAEYYSAELSQKVKRGLRETREKGNCTGGYLLYGYKKDGRSQ